MSDVAVTGTTSSATSKTSKTGSLLGGIGSLGSAAVGALDSLFGFSARRQYRMQKNLMNQQQDLWEEQQEILNQQALDQWNRENEYNDPTNAYKRLLNGAEVNGISRAAALGLLGGNGGGVQTTAASGAMPTASTALPSASGAPYQSIGQGVMNSMRQMAEIDLIEAQTDATYADAGLKGSQSDYYSELVSTEDAKRNLMSQNLATDKQREQSLKLDNVAKNITNGSLKSMTDAQLSKLWNEVQSIKINTEYREKELGVFDKQVNSVLEMQKQQALLYIAEKCAQNALTSNTKADTRYKGITLESLRDTLRAKLKQLQISNIWAPVLNYRQSVPNTFGDIPAYTASAFKGNDPFRLANELLRESQK